jgi:hypothetical protein
MTTYTFEQVRYPATKNLPCPICGRKRRLSKTFTMTINPWNVDPVSGEPRSRMQIGIALKAEASEWLVVPEAHPNCSTPKETPDAD